MRDLPVIVAARPPTLDNGSVGSGSIVPQIGEAARMSLEGNARVARLKAG
jgi:hypothetical protein